jgi:hypothetical protein
MNNPNDSKEDCAADDESDIEQYTSIEDSQYPNQRDVSTAQNVPGLVWAAGKSKRQE